MGYKPRTFPIGSGLFKLCALQMFGSLEIVGCKFVDNFAFGKHVELARGAHLYVTGAANVGGEKGVAILDTTFEEENMAQTWDAIEKSPDVPSVFKPSGGFIPGAIHVQKADILLVNVTFNMSYHWLFQYPIDTSSFIEIVGASITRCAVDSSACVRLRQRARSPIRSGDEACRSPGWSLVTGLKIKIRGSVFVPPLNQVSYALTYMRCCALAIHFGGRLCLHGCRIA
jgi:hypothetical protein